MRRLRLVLRSIFIVLLLTAPAALAQYTGCYTCKTTYYANGTVQMYCADPPPLMYGNEFCEIGDDPWVYCQTFGQSCCLDPI